METGVKAGQRGHEQAGREGKGKEEEGRLVFAVNRACPLGDNLSSKANT